MRSETFATPGRVRLVVKLPAGNVDLETTDAASTTVEVEGPQEDDFQIELRPRGEASEVVVEAAKRFGFSRDHRVTVAAPHGADLEVKTGSADVQARGRYSDVDVLTGSGDVVVDQASELAVKTGSGDVEVRHVEGEAAATTGSGDVELGHIGGGGRFRTGSGEVSIGEADGDISIMTASGDQTIRSAGSGRLRLRAASGDVHVGIRRGSRVFVDARSASGDMDSELELEGDLPAGEGPLVEVDATTASGDVRIARA
jgi:DUF4097 and DUF4098 domain-containing protein YvlB